MLVGEKSGLKIKNLKITVCLRWYITILVEVNIFCSEEWCFSSYKHHLTFFVILYTIISRRWTKVYIKFNRSGGFPFQVGKYCYPRLGCNRQYCQPFLFAEWDQFLEVFWFLLGIPRSALCIDKEHSWIINLRMTFEFMVVIKAFQ